MPFHYELRHLRESQCRQQDDNDENNKNCSKQSTFTLYPILSKKQRGLRKMRKSTMLALRFHKF